MTGYSLPKYFVDDRIVDMNGRTVAKLRLGGFGSDYYPPLWAPDGRLLAVSVIFETDKSYAEWVEVVTADGRTPGRKITPNRESASALSWSPDGRRLLMIGMEGRRYVWFTVRPDGSERHVLITAPPTNAHDWSPDSSTIAYASHGGVFGVPAVGGAPRRLAVLRSRGKQLRSVSVAWSSNGVLAFSDLAGVYTARSDGVGRRRLTKKRGALHWSPDGRRLALASDGEVFTIAGGSGGVRQLTHQQSDDEPEWSPDGRQIVFTRGEPDSVYVMRSDGSGRRLVGRGSGARWSPDGARLAYVQREHIVVADLATGTHRDLAAGTSPAWSPDGKQLTFVRYTYLPSSHGPELAGSSLWAVRADGSELRRLQQEAELYDPTWSPDGKRIAVLAMDNVGWVELVDPDSGSTKVLDVDAEDLRWSPDGDTLAFWSYNGIGVLDVETGTTKTLAHSDSLQYRDVVWSPDGHRIGFVRCANPDGAPATCDVYAINVDGSDLRRLTRTRGLESGLHWGVEPSS